jgi:hypothetical protein
MKKTKIFYRVDNPQGRVREALFHKIKGKLPAEGAMQAQVIRALVLNRDWTRFKGKQEGGKEFSVLVEYIRHRAEASDREFFKNLGRRLTEKPRPYKNAEIEDFLFTNWDTTYGALANGPGLKCFTDDAVVDLLEIIFADRAPSLAAYREIRKAAGLPQEPPKIRWVTRDGRGDITLHPVR